MTRYYGSRQAGQPDPRWRCQRIWTLLPLVACTITGFCPILPAAEPTKTAPPAEPANAVTLRGHVVLPDGKPAAGAELYWIHRNVPPDG